MALYIFDKDGTTHHGPQGRPPNIIPEQRLAPNVADVCANLLAKGHTLAVASNQGGVAWGFMSYEQAESLVIEAARDIGAYSWRMCPHDARASQSPTCVAEYAVACECRKPKAGMLLSIMRRNGFTPEQTTFVGDQESDRLAALEAGVTFVWAAQFFHQEAQP